MRHPILATALLGVLAACGNAAPVPEPHPVTVGNIAVRENWRSSVVVDRVDSILLTMPSGDHQLQRYRRVAAFTLTVDPGGDVTIRLDSLRTVPAAAIDSDLGGATWTGRLGDFSVSALHLSGKSGANALTPLVKSLLPRLPSGGARPRSGWSDSATGRSWTDIFSVSERRTAHWSAGSLSRGDSDRFLPVKLAEEFEQIGEGSQDGQKVTMTAQGRRSGIYYVSTDGEVRSAELTDSAAVSIGVPATRQVMSGLRFTRTDIRFISAGAERGGITVGTTHRR
jgi:hypothetical protein